MRQRPILLKKLIHKNSGRVREVIGLIGTHRGVGVTHTGLMLAFYMGGELGRKTAFLECNHHRDMECIQNAYEWDRETEDSFSYGQLTCYKGVQSKQIVDIYSEDFDCIIMDLGTDYLGNREEFIRCTLKIVVGGPSEWDFPKLLHFEESLDIGPDSNSWLFLIPLATQERAKKIRKELQQRVWSVPFIEDPTVPYITANQLFRRIVHS